MRSKFGCDADRYSEWLDDSCAFYSAGQAFTIVEKKRGGEAALTLSAQFDCIHIPDMDDRRIKVLKNGKCADHLIFVYDAAARRWGLHIFEFKRTVSNQKWYDDIIDQLDGGMLNAVAVCGLLHISDQFTSVTAYCGYRDDSSAASPVYWKTKSGAPAKPHWKDGKTVTLPSFSGLTVGKQIVQLGSEDGTGTISAIGI